MPLDRRYPVIALLFVTMLTPVLGWQNPLTQPVGPIADGRMVVPTNQILNPGGNRITGPNYRLNDVARNAAGDLIAVLTQYSINFYDPAGSASGSVALPYNAGMKGLAFSPDGKMLAASDGSCIMLVEVKTRTAQRCLAMPANSIPAGLVFDPSGSSFYVALNHTNAVARVDLSSGSIAATVTVGVAPLGLAITPEGKRLFVTNSGGTQPNSSTLSALSGGYPVTVDSDGIANGGSVTAINLSSFQAEAEITVGRHPGGLAISPDGLSVAIANANDDSVSIIDAQTLQVSVTFPVEQVPAGAFGSMPTDVAYSMDGSRLYVALGGLNAVASYRAGGTCCTLQGMAPVDWFPMALVPVLDAAGEETLFVGNAKGIGARQDPAPFNVRNFVSSITRLPASRIDTASSANAQQAAAAFLPVMDAQVATVNLAALGVQHVYLIVKENRTYDQVLGDLPAGNGAPGLAIYGEKITPNLHSLAKSYTLFDNYYASGTVSADGHQWVTQAMATAYAERQFNAAWPRSYPYSGEDPLIFAPTGFIWGNAMRHGLTARMFGEFALQNGAYNGSWTDFLRASVPGTPRIATPSVSSITAAAKIHSTSYPAFNLSVPDAYRARLVLDDLSFWSEHANKAPNLVIIQLPGDHTVGTTPGAPTPQAMVADNDLAVGRIIEGISHSPLWATSAVFVVEDDAQDGVDHVDGHRTTCYIASPFAKRGGVDSTNYNHTSIVRTIEDLLGLPVMNRFDATAVPMTAAFTAVADTTPFNAISPNIPLDQLNPQLATLKGTARSAAAASMKMNFRVPDAAPEMKLNKILWQQAKGWDAKYPKPPHKKTCPKDADD